MENAGALMVPILDGAPFTDKPPVHFLFVRALAKAFGFHATWPYVLPSLFAFAALVVLTGWLANRWIGGVAGPFAALFCATFVLAWGSAQSARMDMEFVLLLTAGIALLREGMTAERQGRGRFHPVALLALGGLAIAAAVLIKGAAALAVAALVWIVESLRLRRAPRLADLAVLATALAPPLAWVSEVGRELGGWVAFDLVVTQSMGRAVDSWAHQQPVWYYLERFPALFFPWFALIPLAVVQARRSDSDPRRFAALWLISIFVLFSLISGKLDIYLLPAIVPAAVLLAGWTTDGGAGLRKAAAVTNAVMLAAVAVITLAASLFWRAMIEETPENLLLRDQPVTALLACASISCGVAAALHLVRRYRDLELSVLLTAAGLFLPLSIAALLLTGYMNEVNSSRPLIRFLEQRGAVGRSMVLYQAFHPWGRQFPFTSPEIAAADPWTLKKARGPLPAIVVTRDSRTTELGPPLRANYEKAGTVRIKRKNYDVWMMKAQAPGAESDPIPATRPGHP